MEIELVVFDVAGTTVEDVDAVAGTFRSAVGETGAIPSREAIARVMGLKKTDAIRALLADRSGCDERLVSSVHELFTQRMIHHYLTSPRVRPVPGAETTFAVLRAAGVSVALDTGFERPILDALLLRLGWHVGDVLDATVTSDEVDRGRPAPDMIRRAMDLTGVSDPAAVCKVGDTAADVAEGLAAGCAVVVGVASSPAEAIELRRAGAHAVVRTVADLPDVLARRGAWRPTELLS